MVNRELSLEEILRLRAPRLPLFLLFMHHRPDAPAPGSPEFRVVLREHLLYWWELEEQGVLIAAGPQAGGPAYGDGLAILAARTREEADSIAADEPFARAGIRTNTVVDWTLNEGALVALVQAAANDA